MENMEKQLNGAGELDPKQQEIADLEKRIAALTKDIDARTAEEQKYGPKSTSDPYKREAITERGNLQAKLDLLKENKGGKDD